jgi:hypothetical protein
MDENPISKDMTILDLVSAHQKTIEVFRRYNAQAGECICCSSLFDTIETMTEKYGIDLGALLRDLSDAASCKKV